MLKKLWCIRIKKEKGEEIRRLLKELHLLKIDAKIKADASFLYIPIIRELEEREKVKIGEGAELLKKDFEIIERGVTPIEEAIGFKPSYEITGDIAVLANSDLNLKGVDEKLIGEEIMKRQKNIKVVAKRISPVEGIFRTRKIKIIAGEERKETIHKENGCKYKVDLEKVYFNPRLATERGRVALLTKRNERVIDMFAGVGSFSIQVAKFARDVTGIDINPDATRYLKENVRLNSINNIEVLNGDIREFFHYFKQTATRVIMNLPKKASEFIYEALSMLSPEGGTIHYYDMVNYYDMVRCEGENKKEAMQKAMEEVKEKLRWKIEDEWRNQCERIEVKMMKPYAPYTYIVGIDVDIIKN